MLRNLAFFLGRKGAESQEPHQVSRLEGVNTVRGGSLYPLGGPRAVGRWLADTARQMFLRVLVSVH